MNIMMLYASAVAGPLPTGLTATQEEFEVLLGMADAVANPSLRRKIKQRLKAKVSITHELPPTDGAKQNAEKETDNRGGNDNKTKGYTVLPAHAMRRKNQTVRQVKRI